jgi:hypothetical protein
MKAAKILNTNRPSTIAFALATAVALAVGPSLAAQIKPLSKAQQVTQANAEKNKQFQDLKENALGLARRMGVPKHGEDKELRPQWDGVLAGFQQWAHKFNVTIQETTLVTEAGAAGLGQERRTLPLVLQGPPGISGCLCMKDFARSNDAQWLYKCFPEPKS